VSAALSSMALVGRAPTAAQAVEAANNACAILAMDEDGDHEVGEAIATVVAHRIAMARAGHESFSEWLGVDAAVARVHVGRRVAEWLRHRMSGAEVLTYEAALRMGASGDAAAELATRAEDLAADRARDARRARECWS
jgi:hypothetical protein